jgi:DNA-binding NarL/FixJ family response regulator
MKPDLQPFPPPAMTAKPRLIVCERTGTWAARLRTHLPAEMPLRQTRSLDECLEELGRSPGSLLVLEVSAANLRDVIGLAADLGRRFPHARWVAVTDRANASYEGLLREAGAVHFVVSPRTADILARLAVRHAARVPQPRASLAARIWESLPWHEAATS